MAAPQRPIYRSRNKLIQETLDACYEGNIGDVQTHVERLLVPIDCKDDERSLTPLMIAAGTLVFLSFCPFSIR